MYTFTNLSAKLIFYFLECKDLSCIIYINRREYVRELSVCESLHYDKFYLVNVTIAAKNYLIH